MTEGQNTPSPQPSGSLASALGIPRLSPRDPSPQPSGTLASALGIPRLSPRDPSPQPSGTPLLGRRLQGREIDRRISADQPDRCGRRLSRTAGARARSARPGSRVQPPSCSDPQTQGQVQSLVKWGGIPKEGGGAKFNFEWLCTRKDKSTQALQ